MDTALDTASPKIPDVNSNIEEIRRWRAPMTSAERWVILAVGAVGVMFGLSSARSAIEIRHRRAAIFDRTTAEARALSPREADLLDLTRSWMDRAAATPPSAARGAWVDPNGPRLDEMLARTGLYVRAAAPDITRPGATPQAIRSSVKDSVALCFLAPPSTTGDLDVTLTALRARPGSRELDDATPKLGRLEAVQRGFRVLGKDWADEVRSADSIALGAFEAELLARTPADVASARGWSRGDYFVAVVDDLPEDMRVPEAGSALAASFQTSMLPEVQKRPHDVQVAVMDLGSHASVLRYSGHVDAPALAERTGLPLEDAILAADCALGAEARRAADRSAL